MCYIYHVNLVNEASLFDSKWRDYARKLNCGDYADDVVNEFYLKLSKINHFDKSNIHGFLVVVLRNMINDFHRQKSKVSFVDIDIVQNISDNESGIDNIEIESFVKKAINLANEISPFDGALFEHYLTSKNSYRKIAKGSGISFDTIKVSIKKTKQIINRELKTEWIELTQ